MKHQSPCDDKSLLMAYLYDECDAIERRLVERHLAECAACAAELAQLRGVRVALSEWTPPEQALGFRVVREEQVVPGPARWWNRGAARVPAWAQLAAAVLLLAAGAGIGAFGTGRGAASPADLARLERRIEQQAQQISAQARQISNLREVSTARPAPVSAPAVAAPAAAALSQEQQSRLFRQVQLMVDDNGRRQQRELDQQIAQRFLRLAHDVDTQRVADQGRFLQGLGQMNYRLNQLSQGQTYLLRNVANVQEK